MSTNPVEGEKPKKKPRLTYLDAAGAGDPIRLTLLLGGIDFEDERVSYEVKKRREEGQLPFGQVPVLKLDDGCGPYAQCNAILRWAGKKASLYPEELQFQCDIILEAVQDIQNKMSAWWYGAACGRHPVTSEVMVPLMEEQKSCVAPFLSDVLFPARFAQLERSVAKSGGPYFCGSKLTICDISFFNVAQPLLDGLAGGKAGGRLTAACLDGCPLLKAILGLIREHPKVSKYRAAHC